MTDVIPPFWQVKKLHEMTVPEWESLCDGCAKCCLVKLQDEDTEDVYYTDVACRYLGLKTCQCTAYEERHQLVEACVKLTPDKVDDFFWLPNTCAYRLLAEGKQLPEWHYLISGKKNAVHWSGCSVKGKVFSEINIKTHDLEDHIIRWVE